MPFGIFYACHSLKFSVACRKIFSRKNGKVRKLNDVTSNIVNMNHLMQMAKKKPWGKTKEFSGYELQRLITDIKGLLKWSIASQFLPLVQSFKAITLCWNWREMSGCGLTPSIFGFGFIRDGLCDKFYLLKDLTLTF